MRKLAPDRVVPQPATLWPDLGTGAVRVMRSDPRTGAAKVMGSGLGTGAAKVMGSDLGAGAAKVMGSDLGAGAVKGGGAGDSRNVAASASMFEPFCGCTSNGTRRLHVLEVGWTMF
jgi:hypothetical protein